MPQISRQDLNHIHLSPGTQVWYPVDDLSITAVFPLSPQNDLSPAGVWTYDDISSEPGFIPMMTSTQKLEQLDSFWVEP